MLGVHHIGKVPSRPPSSGRQPLPAPRRGRGPARPKWRGQDDAVLHDHRPHPARRRHDELDGNDVTTLPMYRRARPASAICRQEPRSSGASASRTISRRPEIAQPDPKKRADELEALLGQSSTSKRLRSVNSLALSGGERRRCEIARALAGHPSFMLLDEPFAGIDPIAVADIRALSRISSIAASGVLITDHSVRETLGMTDRAISCTPGVSLPRPAGGDHRRSQCAAVLSRRRFRMCFRLRRVRCSGQHEDWRKWDRQARGGGDGRGLGLATCEMLAESAAGVAISRAAQPMSTKRWRRPRRRRDKTDVIGLPLDVSDATIWRRGRRQRSPRNGAHRPARQFRRDQRPSPATGRHVSRRFGTGDRHQPRWLMWLHARGCLSCAPPKLGTIVNVSLGRQTRFASDQARLCRVEHAVVALPIPSTWRISGTTCACCICPEVATPILESRPIVPSEEDRPVCGTGRPRQRHRLCRRGPQHVCSMRSLFRRPGIARSWPRRNPEGKILRRRAS